MMTSSKTTMSNCSILIHKFRLKWNKFKPKRKSLKLRRKIRSTSNCLSYEFFSTLEELIFHLNEEDHSEDEGIEDYKIGGYHPCHVG
jgi:hypothetical protein